MQHFVPEFNRRFTVTPAQAGSAFVPLVGVQLELLLSTQHERVVRNDSTVPFETLTLQLPVLPQRPHYVRCPVLVHEFPQGTLGISYQGGLLARYDREGHLLPAAAPHRGSAGRTRAGNGTTRALSSVTIVAPGAAGRAGPKPTRPVARPAVNLAQRAAARDRGRGAGRPTRRSPHAGGGGVPRRTLPAPPRPNPHGVAPRPPRSVRQHVENGSPPPKAKGRREV